MENLRVSICLISTIDPSAVRPVMSWIRGAVSVWGRGEKRASSRTEEDLDEHEARGEMNIHCKPRDGGSFMSAVWCHLSWMRLRVGCVYLSKSQLVSESWEARRSASSHLQAHPDPPAPTLRLRIYRLLNKCLAREIVSGASYFSSQTQHFPKGRWAFRSCVSLFMWSTDPAVDNTR